MLKEKLSEAEVSALHDVLKAEYVKKDDGFYYLDREEARELVNALQRLKEANKGNEQMVTSINEELRVAREDVARKQGDLTTLENSWKAKAKAQKEADEAEKAQLRAIAKEGYLNSLLSTTVGKFSLPEKHIRRDFEERIKIVFENGRPLHQILDKEGNVSAMSFDELEKEFLADAVYSQYIIASKARGSAGMPARRPGESGQSKLYHEMSIEEQMAHLANKHKHLQG